MLTAFTVGGFVILHCYGTTITFNHNYGFWFNAPCGESKKAMTYRNSPAGESELAANGRT